jgi:glutamine amidotransferase
MIAIIDYKAGNLTSVKRALDYLGIASEITPDPPRIESADRIIFPGVGHAGTAMAVLKERGIDSALKKAYARGTPVLGICLGTQIVLSHSEEGDTPCLDIIPGHTVRFDLRDTALKIPHMGWDSLMFKRAHFLLKDIEAADEFYFVHSYYPRPSSGDDVVALCEYEVEFPAVIGRRSLVATQFHPEKSGRQGLQILKNFAVWDGAGC